MSKEKVRPLQRSQRDRLQAQQESGSQHFSPCTGYVGHALRTRSFEKRETKEKRGGNGKRERAWFWGEGCCVAVRKCSRSSLRGARHGTSVGAVTASVSETRSQQTSV